MTKPSPIRIHVLGSGPWTSCSITLPWSSSWILGRSRVPWWVKLFGFVLSVMALMLALIVPWLFSVLVPEGNAPTRLTLVLEL